MAQMRKEIFDKAKRVLVKIGSAVLTGEDGLDLHVIEQLVENIVHLRNRGKQVVIVTSGAIASGKHRLGITGPLKSMPQKQAAAAIGQGRLMRVYSNAFGKYGVYVGQVLLTMSDLTDRKRFLNVKNTLNQLLEWKVIPIINENDTVAVEEIKFGDNDQLSAMTANIIDADLVINLTNIEGLYDKNPNRSAKAKIIHLVEEISEEIEQAATSETSDVGTGGMKSKVAAAKQVTTCGIPYVIAPGKEKDILKDLFDGKEKGTLFLPKTNVLSSRKYWIAYTLRSRGKITLDEGAKAAIIEEGGSLLPSGVVNVEGDFCVGDPVSCVDEQGVVIAKGITNYSSEEVRKIMGQKSTKIEQILGYKDYDEVIHRDNMAVVWEKEKCPRTSKEPKGK
jgi:glutamate 5-kinase